MFNKKNKLKIDDAEIMELVMSSHNFNIIRNNKPLSFRGVMSLFALIEDKFLLIGIQTMTFSLQVLTYLVFQ